MELLLIEDYPAVGYVGQTVKVKNGFARNFLIPRGIGVEIGSRRGKYFKHLQDGANARKAKLKAEAEELGKKVATLQLEFEMKLGTQGKSFGSVTAKDILDKVNQLGNYSFERRQLKLIEPIKAPGQYVATLQLHSEVLVELPVKVTAAKPVQEEDAEEGADSKKRGRKSGARKPRSANKEGSAKKEDGETVTEEAIS